MPSKNIETPPPDGAVAYLSFSGLIQDRMGLAMWQADGSGPEPAATGHSFITPIRRVTSHYYIASREYDGLDILSPGGLKGNDLTVGFPQFLAALSQQGVALADIIIRLPLITPGEDREGQDWVYQYDIETRYLRPSAALVLLAGSEPMLELSTCVIQLTENYVGATDFTQVKISAVSEEAHAVDVSQSSSIATQLLARAFLADVQQKQIRLVIDEIRVVPEPFAGKGRSHGLFGEILMSRIEARPK